jgi:hypothetical protein
MAAGLGYIEFTTGDILTAAAANGYLASQTVMVFADAAARTSAIASPQEGMVSYLKDTNAIEYYSGSAWVGVGGSSGKILQVVQGTTSTSVSSTSNTYADTTLTASITPSSATSKVLVMVSQNGFLKTTSADTHAGLILLRGATTIFNISGVAFANAASFNGGSLASSYLDSPATTSSTTYKTQFKNNSAVGTITVQDQNIPTTSSIILMEVGA